MHIRYAFRIRIHVSDTCFGFGYMYRKGKAKAGLSACGRAKSVNGAVPARCRLQTVFDTASPVVAICFSEPSFMPQGAPPHTEIQGFASLGRSARRPERAPGRRIGGVRPLNFRVRRRKRGQDGSEKQIATQPPGEAMATKTNDDTTPRALPAPEDSPKSSCASMLAARAEAGRRN